MAPDPEPPPEPIAVDRPQDTHNDISFTSDIDNNPRVPTCNERGSPQDETRDDNAQPQLPANDSAPADEDRDDVISFASRVFTATSDPSKPLDNIYTTMHWHHRHARASTVDQNLIRFDLPLGMGSNDPLDPDENPLFNGDVVYNNTTNDTLPTVSVKQVRAQVLENKPIQSNQGAVLVSHLIGTSSMTTPR